MLKRILLQVNLEDHLIEFILRKVTCKFQILLEVMRKYELSHITECLRGNPRMSSKVLPNSLGKM